MACHTARSSESRLGFYIPLWYEKKSETFSANCCPWAILIIDDDPDTGETMESGLRQRDYIRCWDGIKKNFNP